MTLIISLFDKINEIQGKNDIDGPGRFTRQLGGRNPVCLSKKIFYTTHCSFSFSSRILHLRTVLEAFEHRM